MPKSLNLNLNFIWDFQKIVFFSLSFTSEKCPRYRINSPENFDIYMSYIKIIYIFLYFFSFSLIQKKAPGASQANRPSQRRAQPTSGPGAAHRRRAGLPQRARTLSRSVARSPLPLSLSLTRWPHLFLSPRARHAAPEHAQSAPDTAIFSGSRSRVAPSSKSMSYKFPSLSSPEPPKNPSPKRTTAHALLLWISPPPPRFATAAATGEHPPCFQATPPEPSVRSSSP